MTLDSLSNNPATFRIPSHGGDFLSVDEEQFLHRILSSPESFPIKFKSWISEYVAVNMQPIPVSLLSGSQVSLAQNQVLTSESTSSTSYVDLSTTGPKISNLADGEYLLIFGCHYDSTGGGPGYMAPSVNGDAAHDDFSAYVNPVSAQRSPLVRAVQKKFAGNNNNMVTMKYRVGSGTNTFSSRWIVLMKVS